MKKGIVKFSKEFVNEIGLREWFGIELEFDMDSETPADLYSEAKKMVAQAASGSGQVTYNNSIAPGPSPVISVDRTSEDVRIAGLIRSMYACTQLDGDDGLFSYYTLASAHVETKAVYEVVKNKLVSKESKELLDAANMHTVGSVNKKQKK